MSFLLNPFALAPAGGGSDPYFANVSALWGFDGSGTFLNDESGNGHTLTAINSFSRSAGGGKFGDAAGNISGGNQYAQTGYSSQFIFPGEFTIEGWVYKPNNTGTNPIISVYNTTGSKRSWLLFWSSGALRFTFSISGSSSEVGITTPTTPATGTWHHVAITRDASNVISIYLNGVFEISATQSGSSFDTTSTPLWINAYGPGTYASTGHLVDEFRITKGVARYTGTGSFTPPTTKFPRS